MIAFYYILRFHSKRVLYLLLLAGFLFPLFTLFINAFTLKPEPLLILDASITLFGVLTFLFSFYLGTSVFPEEIETRSIYPFLTRISRIRYLAETLLACNFLMLIFLLLLYGELSIVLFEVSGFFSTALVQGFLVHLSQGFIWINLAILLSMFATPALNFCLCFVFIILGNTPPAILHGGLLRILRGVFPLLTLFDLKINLLENRWAPATLFAALIYNVVYGSILAILSGISFKRKNL